MTNVRIYHHFDADGYGSAAIIGHLYMDIHKYDIEFIVSSHYVRMNFDKIKEDDIVYMVDFCPSDESDLANIDNLLRKYPKLRLIFLDHHKSTGKILKEHPLLAQKVEEYGAWFNSEDYEVSGIALSYFACDPKLTENMNEPIVIPRTDNPLLLHQQLNSLYRESSHNSFEVKKKLKFMKECIKPSWIRYVDDNDLYLKIYPTTHAFVRGLSYNGFTYNFISQSNPDSYICLMRAMSSEDDGIRHRGESRMQIATQEISKTGNMIVELDTKRNKNILKSNGFIVNLNFTVSKEWFDPNNNYELPYNENDLFHMSGKVLCCNNYGNSSIFGEEFEKYDAVICFNYNGNHTEYSMFSRKENGLRCDVMAITMKKIYKLSGGGHVHAAGWSTPGTPILNTSKLVIVNKFIRNINNEEK